MTQEEIKEELSDVLLNLGGLSFSNIYSLLEEDSAISFEGEDLIKIACHFAEWQKQQMMKDAVEGTIKYEIGSAEIPQCDRRYQVLSDPAPIANAKLGDKVKIIILKTE